MAQVEVKLSRGFPMKITTVGALSIAWLAMSGAPLLAGSVGGPATEQQTAEAAQPKPIRAGDLEQRQEELMQQAMAQGDTGPVLVRDIEKLSKLQNLIDRIKSGEPWSPEEVDQALEQPPQLHK